jgi:5'-nucleotidase
MAHLEQRSIITDMDQIVADFYWRIMEMYHDETGHDLPPDYMRSWDVDFPNGKNIFYYFSQPGFFMSLKPIPGAQDVLKYRHSKGDEILIASAATLTNAPGEKYLWLDKHFPWINRDWVFFGKLKHKIRGDVLIDDHHVNAEKYKAANPDAMVIGIEYPYNVDHPEAFTHLFPSYQDFAGAWDKIDKVLQ